MSKGQLMDDLVTHCENVPIEPRLRRLVRQNASERAVIDALAGSGESLTLIADEGGVVFDSPLFSKAAFLNKVWDGGPVILDRAHGVSVVAKDTRVTTSIMVQPKVLEKFVQDHGETLRGAGFFARFLISRPDSLKGSRLVWEAKGTQHALDRFHQEVSGFLEQEPCDRVLEFDEAAKQVWINFVNRVELDIRPGGYLTEIDDFASKVGEIIARVAAIFHFFEKKDGNISSDTLERAIDVVCYHIEEFKSIFDPGVQLSQAQLDANALCDYMYRTFWLNNVASVPRNYVLQHGPVRGKRRFDAALDTLIFQGGFWVTIEKSKRRIICFNFNLPVFSPAI